MFFYMAAGLFVFVTMTIAFSIGFGFGYKVAKGIHPKLEPLKPIKEYAQKKEIESESKKHDNYLKNLFGYEGEK